MTSDRPDITVVIPTRDRPEQLCACIDALQISIGMSTLRTEILVVENGSARVALDGTGVRVLRESEPNVSRARNRGLEEARGPIVAFIDDDVRVEPAWLDALYAPFDDPDVMAVAGRIELAPVGGRPEWLTSNLESWYSALDHGDEPHALDVGKWGWTANLAVRAVAARAVRGFDPRLGPGKHQRYNEDTEFLDRLRALGTIWYSPKARAHHVIPRKRLTRRWLLRRTFLQGRSDAMIDRYAADPSPKAQVPTRLGRALVRRWLVTARRFASPSTRHNALVRDAMKRLRDLGYVWEHGQQLLRRSS